MKYHTILGATGASGAAVIEELQRRNLPVRAVSRSRQIPNVETVNADVLKSEDAEKAIKGASHVYLCVGLPYKKEVWLRDWKIVMQNVIDACAKYDARLIFLDNIYMYQSPLPVPFDENTLQYPKTQKGKARKIAADLMIKALNEGKIKGVIGRSADFYGKRAVLGAFYPAFLERMLKGKAPQSLGKPNKKHTYANVTDNAKALVMLALDEITYGSEWHLPVGEPITVEEITTIFNQILGTSHNVQFMPVFMRKVLSLFIPLLKEVDEMLYQFEEDYVMSFEKFKTYFPDFEVTSYEKGIEEMVNYFKEKKK